MRKQKNYKLLNMLDKLGSNQTELAEVIGVCYTSIYNKVTGQKEFRASEIAKIKEYYNLSIEDVEDIFLKG